MNIADEIKSIESLTAKNPEWYYHRIIYDARAFKDMLNTGIKCRKLLKQKDSDSIYNGTFYISLYKDLSTYVDLGHSAFAIFSGFYPNFIIEDIHPVKCRNDVDYSLFRNSIFPFRNSPLQDEYQEFWHIAPEKIVGLQCSILNWYQKGSKYSLEILRDIIKIMQEYKINLPIYDYSRASEETAHMIDKERYLELTKKMDFSMTK